MIHKLSYGLTNWFYQHKWIERDNYEWCLYVVEKKILQICFLLILSLCCAISKQYLNTLIFITTFYLLRHRIGGWHAPYPWQCIFLTMVIIFTVLYVVAPALTNINYFFLWIFDVLLIITALLTGPIYPPHLHFNQDVLCANRKRKNLFVLFVFFVQIVFFHLGMVRILIFSFNGILISILLVFAEKLKCKCSS